MTPKNPWVARVWETMTRTHQTASAQEIVEQFGGISGTADMAPVIYSAVRQGWLRKVGTDRYVAGQPIKTEKGPIVPWKYVDGLGQVSSVFELGGRA